MKRTAAALILAGALIACTPDAPAQRILFEDNFDGDLGTPLDSGLWTVEQGGALDVPKHDGNGNATFNTASMTWRSPSITSTFRFTADGTADYQVDWYFSGVPSNPSITWLGVAVFGGDGSTDRGWMFHPAVPMKMYSNYVGIGIPDGNGGNGVVSDVSTAPGAGGPYALRLVLRQSGALEWYYDAGSGWIQAMPTTMLADGFERTQASVDFLNSYDVAGGSEYSVALLGNGCCGSTGPFALDRVVVTNLDEAPAIDPGEGGPDTISIQGQVSTASGLPVTGTHGYRVQFFNDATVDAQLGADIDGSVTFAEDGRFAISVVPPGEALAIANLWFALYLDTDDNGIDAADLFGDRIRVESVPFAHRAKAASEVAWDAVSSVPPGFADGIDNVGGGGGPSGSVFDVTDFGATGNGTDDDTDAIQTAINTAKSSGGTVFMPPGTYSVRSLDMTDVTHGMTLLGSGINQTRIMPRQSNVSAVIDLTGSAFVNLRNFQLGAFSQTITPKTAVMLAQSTPGDFRSNAFHFDTLYITGKYSVATFYCYGVPSSDMINCDWYNYHPGDPNTTVMSFTFDNYAGVQSEFTPTHPTGSNTSDWTITAGEIHDLSQQTSGEASVMTALRLQNTMQMRWVGGNISGEGPRLIRISGSTLNDHITFLGTTLYSEVGVPPGRTFHVDSRVRGLSVMECWNQAKNEIFGGSANATFDEITYHCKPTASFGSATHVFNVTNGTLRNSLIHCDGLQLRLGTIEGSNLLINPGAISATTDDSTTVPP